MPTQTPVIRRVTGALLVSFAMAVGATGCGASDEGSDAARAEAARLTDARRDAAAARVRARAAAGEREVLRLRREVAAARKRREAIDAQSRRDVSASGAASGATGAPAGGSARSLLSPADRMSFRTLERSLGGASGVAVSRVGRGQRVARAGSLQTAVAWSTSKVPVAMAAIQAGEADEGALTRAITASDNASAETIWDGLGGGERAAAAATEQLRSAGDETTEVQSQALRSGYTAFGQTVWSLADQVRFTAGMPCTDTGQQVLGLMARTIPAQRWGLGATSWSASIKGGWGPGSAPGQSGGYVDRQMGILTSGGTQLAVTILTRPSGGSHEAGTANLTRIAKWAVTHVNRRDLSSEPAC